MQQVKKMNKYVGMKKIVCETFTNGYKTSKLPVKDEFIRP